MPFSESCSKRNASSIVPTASSSSGLKGESIVCSLAFDFWLQASGGAVAVSGGTAGTPGGYALFYGTSFTKNTAQVEHQRLLHHSLLSMEHSELQE